MDVHKFSCAEATNLVFNLLNILQKVHAKGVIHRDIKPSNIILYHQILFLIDFGVACFVSDMEYSWAGTMSFSALPAMQNFKPAPNHDYESLIYMAVFLVNKKLPWSHLSKPEQVIKAKQDWRMNFEEHCDGFPETFIDFAKCVLKQHQTRSTAGVIRVSREPELKYSFCNSD